MLTRMGKSCIVALALVCAACGADESVEDYNKKQADRVEAERPKGKKIVVTTALPGGITIPCPALLDVEKLTTLLAEKDPVTLKDETAENPGVTSVCSIRRGGKEMNEKKMKELAKKTGKLGVLAGDELFNVTVHCSLPAEANQFKLDCKNQIEKGKRKSNEEVGTYACIRVTPKGPNDSYTYQFIDTDSRCVMSVRAGPSVNEEAEVLRASKAVFELVGPEQIEAAKKQHSNK